MVSQFGTRWQCPYVRKPLAPSEVNLIIEHAVKNNITPFINTVNMDSPNHEHVIYHSTPKYQVERDLIEKYFSRTKAKLDTIESLPATAHITNISMIEMQRLYTICINN